MTTVPGSVAAAALLLIFSNSALGDASMTAKPNRDCGEAFRVLENNKVRHFREYRTRRLALNAWKQLYADGLMPRACDGRTER